jgi:FkbM family methyltransferase
MAIALSIKKLLNRAGYDITYFRPRFVEITKDLDIQTVLDIGANDGAYARESCERFKKATVHAFEPLESCYQKLEHMVRDEPRIKPHQYALGAREEERTITKSTFHPSSSLLAMSGLHKKLYPKSIGGTEETISVKRLDDVAPELHIVYPMLVKIDVQGFEDKVIEGGKYTLSLADIIIVETSFFELYEGQPLSDTIRAMLHTLGFKYYGALHTHYSKSTQRPIYEDSIFISQKLHARFASEE